MMHLYRPYRCLACGGEKEILTEDDGPCVDYCDSCSITPDRHSKQAHTVTAFDSTRTLRPFECIESWINMDVDVHEDVMKKSLLFKGMPTWQVKRVIMLADIRSFHSGDTIVKQGHQDQYMYVLLEGSVRVVIISRDGEEVEAAIIHQGEVFGEVAPILGRPRTASVVAVTEGKVMALDGAAIDRIGRFYPRIAFNISRNSARVLGIRFQHVNSELAEWKRLPAEMD